jgi:signal transduction histidine kinase/DNA-binding response OmpR family regulator
MPTSIHVNTTKVLKAVLLCLLLFLTAFLTQTTAQQDTFTPKSILKSLDQANKLMIAKRSQSAIAITTELMEQLKKKGQYDSPLGLKVRLVHGSALMDSDTSQNKLNFLLKLKETSKATKQWEVFAETCRVIALELEYAMQSKESLSNLREAQATIKQYHLDSSYPHFAVRISSWHRIFGDRDSSIFYAEIAVRTAPKFGAVFEEAAGQWLLGLNYAKTDSERAISHFRAGAQLFLKIEAYTSFCSLYINMARLNLTQGNPRKAMTNIDSILLFYPLTRENNVGLLYRIYRLKGDAFQQMGQPDSAIFYLKEGQSEESKYKDKRNLEKIVEINNKYNDAQQEKELETKKLQLVQEKKNRNWLLAIAAMVIGFAGVLTFYYLRLQKANLITRQQSEQLKSLDIAKSRFFANVSHELRTPLTLILGPIRSLLKENRLNEKQTQLLQMVNRGGKQLEQLVAEILDLRKLEMGKMEVYTIPTRLSAFFSNYAAQFESLAQSRQIDFSFETVMDKNLVVQIDQEKCRQILYNLLSNAFKFTPTGGQIKAKLTVNKGILQLEVADTGPGIHPDDLPHIFDRYFQTTRPEKPAEGGTGIGLALCHEYARLFGGHIEVKSVPGEGTVFKVAIPIILAEAEALAAPGLTEQLEDFSISAFDSQSSALQDTRQPALASTETSGSTKPTILVVEDNPELQEYIRLILSEKYQVFSAEHGQAALSMMNDELGMMNKKKRRAQNSSFITHHSSFNPDLILSDLMMPVMDGYQLLEKLKSNDSTRNIPVIMLTARADIQDKLKALRIGVDDYLLKPFDEEELLARIENLLKNQTARRTAVADEPEPPTAAPLRSLPDQEWLEGFESYVGQHLADDTLSVSTLAYHFAMSESTLLRQLKRLTGLSPIQYLQEVRLNEARRLLENRRYSSIAQVASKVGYDDTRSFSRSFRQRFGKLPSELLDE